MLHLVGCLYYLYFIIFFWDLLNNLNLFLYIMSCISERYLFWFVKYSHFTYMMCCYLNVDFQVQRGNKKNFPLYLYECICFMWILFFINYLAFAKYDSNFLIMWLRILFFMIYEAYWLVPNYSTIIQWPHFQSYFSFRHFKINPVRCLETSPIDLIF